MKRITVPVPSAPLLIGLVFALLLALFTSSFTSSAATPASVQATDPGLITGCVGSSNPGDSSLSLGGRAITSNTILRIDPSGTCAANESALTWNAEGPQGPKGDPTFTHTVVVTTTSDAVNNGNRLLSAMTTISNANPSPTNFYLLKLEPGNFDIGSNSLNLVWGVDLEGSGRDITIIISSAGSAASVTGGAINLATHTSVRDLTVLNQGTANYFSAIYAGNNVYNSYLTDVTIFAEGPNPIEIYGLYIKMGSIIQVQNSVFTVSIDTPTSNTSNIGIYNSGTLTVLGTNIFSGYGNTTSAIKTADGNTLIQQSTLVAYGARETNQTLHVEDPAQTTVQDSTLLANNSFSGSHSTAIYNASAGTVIQNSVLKVNPSIDATPNYAITNLSTLKVASSQITSGVNNTGTLKCIGAYDDNFDPLSSTCS